MKCLVNRIPLKKERKKERNTQAYLAMRLQGFKCSKLQGESPDNNVNVVDI